MRLIITRPMEDALPVAEALRARGHTPIILPLMEIVAREGVALPQGTWQAVCVTSANGIRHAPRGLDLNMPMLCVGAQSAAAARARGFRNVTEDGGDVNGLARFVLSTRSPAQGPLLYLSGAETSGDLAGQLRAAGFAVTRLVTYDAKAIQVPGLPEADGVLLYSPRTARLWAAAAARLHADVTHLTHFCLSEPVAAALPDGLKKIFPDRPSAAAMLGQIDLAVKTA